MRIELIDTVEGLKGIQNQWLELMEQSSSDDFFLLPQWFFAWWSVFSQEKSLFFIAVWKVNGLCGLFPLVKIRKGPFRVIALAGLPRAGRMDFLLADDCREESLKAFFCWLYEKTDWDLLSLRSFGPFSGNPQLIEYQLLKNGKCFTLTKEEACYYIPTEKFEDFDHYLRNSRSTKTRKSFRRKKRKLIKTSGAQWEIIKSVNESLVDEMADLDKRRSLRGKTGNSFFSNNANRPFLKFLITKLTADDRIRCICLRIDGVLHAFDLLFIYSGKVLSYQTAFDCSLYSYGVGNLTLLESLDFTFGEKMKTYDFLSGDDSYKSIWADQYHQNWRLQVYGTGLRSKTLFFYHRVIKPLRRKANKIPAVRRILPRKFRSQWDI